MNTYEQYLKQTSEYGTVSEARYPLVVVDGLPGAVINEVVIFEDGQLGYIMALKRSEVQIALLSRHPTPPGTKLTRTNQRMHIPIGPGQLGDIIDPLGVSILSDKKPKEKMELRPIDIQPPHIRRRAPIKKQLFTGASIVDLLVPLAAGQREAIIGDQKTGKTSFLLAAAKAHAETGGIVVYAAIGRPLSEIRRIADFLRETAKSENIVLLASGAEDVPSLIAIAPYSAMTIAEYWRDQGHDVLLILQDMSTHARYYRELALLAERFPGRESYPGDIFHAHARLLERAGSFRGESSDKTTSITCLVVGETVRSDVSGYIISNLISITDGHLMFDPVRFSEGQLPAVDIAGSVTRVGRKVQPPLAKELYLDLIALLSRYEQAQQFTKFGTELNKKLLQTLTVGARLLEFLSQPSFLTVPLPVQLVMVGVIWNEWLNVESEEAPGMWRDRLVQHYNDSAEAKAFIDKMVSAKNVEEFFKKLKENKEEISRLCQAETL